MIEGIVSRVQHVSDLMRRISGATVTQSTRISEVGRAVHAIDDMTQRNAARVEQATAAAASLDEQAGRLTASTYSFKLQPTRYRTSPRR